MPLVLFVPDFVLADEPEVLRACPVSITAEQCRRISNAVGRHHVVSEAAALQSYHICADKDPARRGFEAIPEAVAVGFIEARRLGEARVGVCAPVRNDPHGINDRIDTIILSNIAYHGAVAGNELREAFFRHQRLTGTTHLRRARQQPLFGVFINLRLAARSKSRGFPSAGGDGTRDVVSGAGVEDDRCEFAVGLPLYDAAGFVIDLRRYTVLGGIAHEGLEPAAELLKQLARRHSSSSMDEIADVE